MKGSMKKIMLGACASVIGFGVTVHAGLPYPITTSAHGSAYDIVGKGIANVRALKEAFLLVCSMA